MAEESIAPADAPVQTLTTSEVTLEDIAAGRLPTDLAEVMAPDLPEAVTRSENPKAKSALRNVQIARLRAAAILGLRLQGYSRKEIGEILEIQPESVKRALTRARQRGYLNDVEADLRHDSLPLALEGLNALLAKKDKDAIFKTLEGLGEFKSFKNITGEQTNHGLPPLQVNIVNAPVQAHPSNGVGKPRED